MAWAMKTALKALSDEPVRVARSGIVGPREASTSPRPMKAEKYAKVVARRPWVSGLSLNASGSSARGRARLHTDPVRPSP